MIEYGHNNSLGRKAQYLPQRHQRTLPPARLRPVQDTLTDEDNLTKQDALFLEVTDVVEERDRLVAS